MNELDRTVRMKLPAPVIDTRPVILMTAPYHRKADLAAAVLRQARRGEVRPYDEGLTWNREEGQWEIRVVRLREPAPAWIRPAIVTTTILAGLSMFILLGWWMMATLAGLPLALFLIVAFGAICAITRAGRQPAVTVTQTVVVKR